MTTTVHESRWRSERARIAALTRGVRAGERDQSELDAAKVRFKGIRAEEYVQKLLAERPTLTDEQRTRLAELLRPVRVGGA